MASHHIMPKAKPVDSPAAGDALRQSRAANYDRLRAGNALPPNYALAERHAARALDLRLKAHEADPKHVDPEWLNDTAPHEDLVAFLTTYGTLP